MELSVPNSLPTFFIHSKPCLPACNLVSFQSSKTLLTWQLGVQIRSTHHQRSIAVLQASSGSQGPSSSDFSERWLLEPVGNGDTRHIGFKVKMPDAFEIASSQVTVGRLPGKADVVIPVATVSGLHARIQKKEGILVITDLDSTNGTFIDEKRLKPGVAAAATSGSLITFGDTNLAIFRVSKLENVEIESQKEGFEDKVAAEITENTN